MSSIYLDTGNSGFQKSPSPHQRGASDIKPLPARRWIWASLLTLVTLPVAAEEALVLSSISTTPSPLISTMVLKEAYAAIGKNIVIRLYPAERALVEPNAGRADGALHRIEGIEKNFPDLIRIPVPINVVDIITVVKRPELQLRTWQDLQAYRLGVVRGIVLYEKRTAGMNVTRVQYDEELLPMVAEGRIDAAVFDRSDALFFLRLPKYRHLRITEPSLEKHPLFHYVNKKHRDLVPKLQAALETMERNGRIEAIRQSVIHRMQAGRAPPPFPVPVENLQEERRR